MFGTAGERRPTPGSATAGFGGFGDIFDAFFGGTQAGDARRGHPLGRRRPPLRPPDHVRGGGQGRREGDRVHRARPLRDVLRQRRGARHGARDLPAVRRPRRDPDDAPDDARPDGQRLDLPAVPGRGQADRPTRARPARATAGRSASGPSGSRSRPGIDEGHQIRLSNEGEVGPRGGPPGSLYVAVHVAPHPQLRREGTELVYDADVSIAQAALGTTISGADRRRRRRRSRSRPAPSPARRSGCAAAACRTSAGRVRAATSTCSSTSSCPRSCRSGSASCSTEFAAEAERAGVGERRRDPRQGSRRAWLTARPRARESPRRPRRRAPGSSSRSPPIIEAVEAVSEILGRVAPVGTSVEPAFELVDEGLGARVDPTRPAIVRAYLPARRRGARRAGRSPRRRRRSATSRRSACGRSASSRRASSTRPTGPRRGRSTSRCSASGGGS